MAARKTPGVRRRAATRQDVADAAGVAPSTVSLVLNDTPGTNIPQTTRDRVMVAAQRLGYRSSAIARALVTGCTMTVGVVIHFMEKPFQSYAAGVLDGVWSALQPAGYRMLMAFAGSDACIGGLFRERGVDGVLVLAAPSSSDDRELQDAVSGRFPMVFVGAAPAALAVDYVDIDNRTAGRCVTEMLIAAGHRRILHLAGPLAVNSSAVDRLAGYRDALEDAGIPWDQGLVIDASYNERFAEERVGAAVDQGLSFTAIAAANHGMAQGAVRALRQRGIWRPADVSVAAIDRRTGDIPITCLEQPLPDIGATAARLLLERMQGADDAARRVFLPCRVVDGGSIVPPSLQNAK